MKKKHENSAGESRLRSLKALAKRLLETGVSIARGKYPLAEKIRAGFDSFRKGFRSGAHKARINRIASQDPSFGVCLAIFSLFLIVCAIIVPASRSFSRNGREFFVDAPAVPDPSEPNVSMLVYLRFDRSSAPLDMIDRAVTEGIDIDPPVPGTWKWESDRSLSFTPMAKWKPGQKYAVSFKKSIFGPSNRGAGGTTAFVAPPITCSFGDQEFYVHPEDASVSFLSATLKSNYAVSEESVRKAIRARYRGKALGFSVTSDATGTEFYIQSDKVSLPEEEETATVSLDGEIDSPSFGAKERLSESIGIDVPSEKQYASVLDAGIDYVLDEASKYGHVLFVNTRGRTTVKRVGDSIEAWVLPKDLPASPGIEAIEDFEWQNPDLVGPAVMKLSRKLALKTEPSETESASTAAFSFPATPSAYVYVRIKAGLVFNGGYLLKKDFKAILRTESLPVSARFLKEGVLMSSRGDKSLTVISYGIDKIGFRVHRVIPDQVNHLITQSRGDIRNLGFSGYGDFDETNVSMIFEREFPVLDREPGEPSYTTLDLSDYMDSGLDARMRYGLFLVDAYRGGKEGQSHIARRLIMVSDLGFMVKRSIDGARDVFVMGVRSGLPVEGASVSVVGRNGIEVIRASTDAEGHARIPDLRGLKREKEPVAFIVKNESDMTFLPYDSEGRFLDYSNFDVGGEMESSARSAINAYLFSDRGLYRPGETARLGIIAKQKNWSEPVSGVKLVLRVSDPRGSVVMEKTVVPGELGLTEEKFETRSWSPTGEYQACLYIDKEKEDPIPIGSASFKVEEFLPDRLKIGAVLDPDSGSGWIKPEGVSAKVSLRNLFGNPAQGNAVTASLELVPVEPYFPGYADYEFQISGERPSAYRAELPPTATDDSGSASFELPVGEYQSPLYRLSFYCQGFEKEGGRNVSATAQALVSPLDFLVGFSVDGNLDYVNRGSGRNLRFIAVDPSLKRTAVTGLSLSIQKRQWVSVLTRQENGLYKYRSIERKIPVSSAPLTIAAGGAAFSLDTSEAGDFEFIVLKDDVELLKRDYSVIGQGNVARSLDQNAELKVKLDKADYEPGESISVSLTAPYSGSGLITVERDRIYAWKWFRSDSSSSVQSIVLPPGIRGNAYVNVSFIRASDSREVYMSPLCYGTANFSIARGSLDDAITLKAPELARPGETLSIEYASRHPGKMVLYGVDEGILQVARYKLPDPLAHFLRKRALEVSTYQILDLILPNFLDERSSAPGGGEDLESLARNLNPFKRKGQAPVAFWSGVIDCGPEGGTYRYRVPDYFNGTLRIMAVSAGRDSLGSAQRAAVIKDKLIVTPQLPNFVSPGDSFAIPVTVTNNIPGSGKGVSVRVTMSTGPGLRLDAKEQTAKVDENGDATVYFQAKAIDSPGAAGVSISASCAGATSGYASEISVRPPTPFRTIVKTGRVAKGKKAVAVNEKKYYPEYRTLRLSASYLTLGLSKGLLAYLESYPYGCSEQILSQAFPKVALYSVRGFEAFDRAKVAESVDYACGVLLSRQNTDGSIGLWTASGKADAFVSSYAAHFLTEAREKGFSVPRNLSDRLIAYLRESVKDEPENWFDAYAKAYGVYVLTRNEKVATEEINSLRAWLRKNPSGWANSGPGLFLAASYSLLKMDGESKTILDALKTVLDKASTDLWIGFPENETAVKAYLHAKHFPKSRQDVLSSYPERFVEFLENGRYSSFSSSMTILALAEYAKISAQAEKVSFQAAQTIGKNANPIPMSGSLILSGDFSPDASKVEIENASALPVFFQAVCEGFESAPPGVSENHGVEVYHEMTDSSGAKITETALGDEILMKTKYRSLGDSEIGDLVIVDMLPGGFDPDIESIRAAGESGEIEYVDIREDRVVFYLNAGKAARNISYKLRSVSRGAFNMAPSYAASMYDPSVWSMNAASSVTVK